MFWICHSYWCHQIMWLHVLLSLSRVHHAHHTAVGRGRVRQSVQPLHSRAALAACWRLTAGAEASYRREGPLLGHRLWPPCLPQHHAQWDVRPLPGGDLRKPGLSGLTRYWGELCVIICSSAVCVCFQRWNPVDGFTDTLLPTDRWPWSDVTGLNPQPLHSFQLPSSSWEWEGDWYVDQSCGGEPSQTGVSTLFFTLPLLWKLDTNLLTRSVLSGLGVCRRFPRQLFPWQEMEFLRPPSPLDPIQEIHCSRHMGQGLDAVVCLSVTDQLRAGVTEF